MPLLLGGIAILAGLYYFGFWWLIGSFIVIWLLARD